MDRLTSQQPSPRELSQEECRQVSGGLVADFQNMDDFPRIIWPVINVALVAKIKAVQFNG